MKYEDGFCTLDSKEIKPEEWEAARYHFPKNKKTINWLHKPLKCDCGKLLEERNFNILNCMSDAVYLEVVCDCGMNWLVDTAGTSFLITEK